MLHIQILTPEKALTDTEADEVIVPTTTGELTLLPHHVPLMTQVAPGIVTIKINGREELLAVDGGFLEVTEKEITILADYGTTGKEVSAIKAEEAKKAAQKAMEQKTSDVDFADAERAFARAILDLKLAGRLRKNN